MTGAIIRNFASIQQDPGAGEPGGPGRMWGPWICEFVWFSYDCIGLVWLNLVWLSLVWFGFLWSDSLDYVRRSTVQNLTAIG